MNGDPIAYTYEADYHCPEDAIARLGQDTSHYGGYWPTADAVDNEGNPIGAVAPWDEWWNVGEGPQTLACGDCGKELDTYDD